MCPLIDYDWIVAVYGRFIAIKWWVWRQGDKTFSGPEWVLQMLHIDLECHFKCCRPSLYTPVWVVAQVTAFTVRTESSVWFGPQNSLGTSKPTALIFMTTAFVTERAFFWPTMDGIPPSLVELPTHTQSLDNDYSIFTCTQIIWFWLDGGSIIITAAVM